MAIEDSANSESSSVPTATKAVIISGVMFVFISYWRVAAVVLCDLASTAFYIGGIVEHSIGPAAPWFIVAVMLFSYAVRSVYIESCSMFVRGGVYKIVKESLGRTTAKFAVAALLFDYVLTGPISGVSAGQYLMSLFFDLWSHFSEIPFSDATRDHWKAAGSVVIAVAITLYFFRLNVIGIHESSDKALKIMIITTIMGVTILGWSLLTLAWDGPRNTISFIPTFTPKENPSNGQMESPLGFLEGTSFAAGLLDGWNWLSLFGVVGFFIAFGHSVLAMSGEETLAQIYREVESPKLKNFQRAAFIVFIYSLVLTGGISVLAVLLIPDEVRMDKYGDNLIAGLAMNVVGPPFARLLLSSFVVCVGSLILAGAVNTAIIGSNGVLNRVAEDGVIPDWLRKPHPRFGTSYRLLYVILALQLFTIVVSRGDVLLLGEAYAFGVVWSFVFNCLAMLILRFKDPERPRGFKVPLNIKIGDTELPIGLGLIFLILLISAVTNALTKEIATEAGLCFTLALFTLFSVTEYFRQTPVQAEGTEALDQFNEIVTDSVTPQTLKLTHPHRKVVAVRASTHLEALDKVLDETDADSTDIITMTANVRPLGGLDSEPVPVGRYEQELMNAIEKRAETAGKPVIPIIVSTNNALHAVMQTVQSVNAQELYLGTSERFSPDELLNRCVYHWSQMHSDQTSPLTIHIIGNDRDFTATISGGGQIPAAVTDSHDVDQSIAMAPTSGHLLFVHDTTPVSAELFDRLLILIDRNVQISILKTGPMSNESWGAKLRQARDAGRQINEVPMPDQKQLGNQLVKLINDQKIGLLILGTQSFADSGRPTQSDPSWIAMIAKQTNCRILFDARTALQNNRPGLNRAN